MTAGVIPEMTVARERRSALPWLLLLSGLVVVLDRMTKMWIAKHVEMGSAIPVIPGVFRITHVLNTGAAFSLFTESVSPVQVRYGLIGFSIFAVAVVLGMLWKTGRSWSASAVGLALVLGGAIGNLYDRMVLHSVIDFLEVHIVRYHWPDFNVADSCICIGAVLLMLEVLWPARGAASATKRQG